MNETSNDLFIGRLGVNPELKYTRNLKPVCHLSVGVSSQGEERANWRKVLVWGEQAELCSIYLKKGSQIFVQGRIEKKNYTNKSGESKTYDEVNAQLIGFSNL
jgi:single-strand DNA-binding protein